jgi:ethanolamine utilization protein EutQ (cupin superfamily)
MDLGNGVFVTKLSTDQWEPDPDVGGEMHNLCRGVGLSRYGAGAVNPIDYTMPERESFLVLEGQVRIEIADGPTLELKAGDIASIPMGAKTTWHITVPYREFWVFGSVADENKQL